MVTGQTEVNRREGCSRGGGLCKGLGPSGDSKAAQGLGEQSLVLKGGYRSDDVLWSLISTPIDIFHTLYAQKKA